MNEKYVQLIEDLVEVSRSALHISKKCEVLAVNAAKLYASTATPGNRPTTPCEVAASCPNHRCRECRRYYDDLYQLT